MRVCLDAKWQLTLFSVVQSGWLKFEYIQDIIHILVICNFKKDPISSNREKVETSIFLDIQGQLTL